MEHIFSGLEGIVPHRDQRNRLVDFTLFGTEFDHKTTVFPVGFSRSLDYALKHPAELISWLYAHQSQEQRKHYENRLFIVVYSGDGQHWKIKAEISFLKKVVVDYVATFEPSQLEVIKFSSGKSAFSDIIWAIK